MQFSFADQTLDTDRRELRRGSEPVAMEPQVFDLLVYLLRNRDRVVSKDDLIASVWNGRIVSDSTLTSRVNAARKAIGDSGDQQKFIRTIARKGFRFVGAVRTESNSERVQGSDTPREGMQGQLGASLPLPDRPAIAVLPFINMSGDAEQDYFSDGISEDIITALSKLRWFFVIARNSSFIFKGKAVHMKQVASELGVGYVVEGSVRKAGDRVRITAQLNEVATGSQIWAERYDRSLADVFAVQDEITEAIIAQGYYGLALSYCGRWQDGGVAARRALRLSPRDPFSAIYYGIDAYAQFIGRNYDEAMRLSREAIRQRSDFVGAHRVLTAAAGMAGQYDVAKVALQELRRVQPNMSLAWIASQIPIKRDADQEHYLEGFRRAGLD